MKTDRLRINQLSAPVFDWYVSYLRALDARDISTFGAFLAATCEMQTNNDATLVGKSMILDRIEQHWESIDALEHDLLNIYGTDECFMLEAWNHYVYRDGRTVSARAVALTDRDDAGLVKSIRLYTATTPFVT